MNPAKTTHKPMTRRQLNAARKRFNKIMANAVSVFPEGLARANDILRRLKTLKE